MEEKRGPFESSLVYQIMQLFPKFYNYDCLNTLQPWPGPTCNKRYTTKPQAKSIAKEPAR